MKTLAFVQQKGGVSKTTNTINVGGALNHCGRDVLLVDADPQGYLTNELGFKGAYTSDGDTLYDVLKEPSEYDPREIVVSHDEFDVLPSHIQMFKLEQDLIAAGWKVRERLSAVLDQIDDYDYVVIDAPPSLGPINDNVLLAAKNVLIPVEAEASSELALTHLFNQISTLEDRYDTTITEQGVVISNVTHPIDNEQRSVIHGFARDFREVCPVYEVRNRTAINRSNGSIFNPESPECDQKPVYERIARDVEERL